MTEEAPGASPQDESEASDRLPARRSAEREGGAPPARRPGGAAVTLAGAALGVAVGTVIALAVMYRSQGAEIAALRESQRQLTSEIASMRRTPIIDVSGAPFRGPDSAIVTLIEYSDYECPYCITHFTKTMPEIEERLIKTGRVRYVFRDFPVDENHPEAIRAHQASRCAAEQGRFWEMHNRLFSAPGTHSADALASLASSVGLDPKLYQDCMASDRTTIAIRQTAQQAVSLGANGTPAFFIGLRDPATNQVRIYRAITGAQPIELFEQTIDLVAKQQ
jgi:protein-disulfide isomerase